MKKSQEFIEKIYNCRVEELTQQINEKWKKEKQNLKDSSEENSKSFHATQKKAISKDF